MRFLSEFYSTDLTKSARVYIQDERPVVEFIEAGRHVAFREYPNHSLCYAEDAAENYTMGILKLTE